METDKLKPTNDFVLLEESKTEPYHVYKQFSHVVVPAAFEYGPEDRPIMGKVIAKGEACIKATIPIGCIAMAGKWTGARFQRDGFSYVLVKESDILGILE